MKMESMYEQLGVSAAVYEYGEADHRGAAGPV